MSEFLSTREVDELFEQLRDAAQAIFGGRLDLAHLLEHQLTIATSNERYDFRYVAPHLGATSLQGIFSIAYWEPSNEPILPTLEDVETNYGGEVFAVNRTDYMFDFYDRDFDRKLVICKCIFADESCDSMLYETVDEIALTHISENRGDEPDVELLTDALDLEPPKISYRDREELARILFRVGVLI